MAIESLWFGRPPKAAVLLGSFGLFPFLSLAVIAVVGPPAYGEDARDALAAYGAVILSFLGGAHWGYCIAGARRGSQSSVIRLIVSVVPAVIGWAALLAPTTLSLYGLAGALTAMLLVDIWSARSGWAPVWYPMLRWPLSAGAVSASLVAVAA